MFNSYEITTALVSERQATLRNEARQHRLARGARRAPKPARKPRLAALLHPTPAGASLTQPLLP